MRNVFTFLVAIFLFSSCVSQTKMLQLMNTGTKLKSTHAGTNATFNAINPSVSLTNIQGIRQWPQVKQEKYRFIPLVVYTNWNSTYNCQIGVRDVEENLKQNLEWALQQKFIESPLFSSQNSSPYSLEVSVDTIKSNIPFVSKGNIIFALVAYTYWFQEGVEASDLKITTSYKLSQNGEIINQGSVSTRKFLEPGENNRGSKKKYMERYMTNYFGIMNRMLYENAETIVKRLETEFLSRQ